MEDCIFCKIVKGEASAEKIWEDEDHIAILDIFPNTTGFTVVLTKKHLPSYAFENSEEVLQKIIVATKKVALLLDRTFDDVGRTGMFFEGFGVDHLHSKLFPMHGTANMKEWEALEEKAGEKDEGEFFERYPGYLVSRSSKRVDQDKLHELAEKIRVKAEEK